MTPERRAYAREYARMQRAAKLAQRNAGSTTCQKRIGLHGVCRGLLETVTDGDGRSAIICPLCERQRRGICRECGLPVEGRVGYALRCAYHNAVERKRASERYRLRRPAEHRRSARRVYQNDAEKRRQRNEYKRAWRKLNRDKVRAQKRRANLRGYGQRAQAERRARVGVIPATVRTAPRTCVTRGCSIVVTGRKKKCTRCKERERQAAASFLASRSSRRHAA